MGRRVDKRIRPGVLRNDAKVVAAVAGFGDYSPQNPAALLAQVTVLQKQMTEAREREVQTGAAAAAARDAAELAERAFHAAVLAMKRNVTAQYGENSDQHQAVGLKKKSEHDRPGPRPGFKRKATAQKA